MFDFLRNLRNLAIYKDDDVKGFKASAVSGNVVLSGCGIEGIILDIAEAELIRDRISEAIKKAKNE